MTIRVSRTEDLDGIAELDRLCFPTDEPLTTDELVSGEWWIATDGADLVGFVGGIQYQIGELHLLRYGVAPECQSKGLGRRLVRALQALVRKTNIRRVTTYVLAYNMPSFRCLLRCGFMPYHAPGDWFIWLEWKP